MKKLIYILIIHCTLLTVNLFAQSITWQRTYNGPFNLWDFGYEICAADNSNFYIGGYTWTPERNIYILKINPYGDTIWTRVIPANRIQEVYAIVNDGYGNCVFTGYSDTAFTGKIDSSGNLLWMKYYTDRNVQCWDLLKAPDGGYIVCGNINSFDAYVLKVDSLGNYQWSRTYPALHYRDFNGVSISLDGGYIITGTISDYIGDTSKILVIKIDSLGTVVWEKRHLVNNLLSNGHTIQKIQYGYIIGGTTADTAENIQGVACFLKIDVQGNALYSKTFFTNKSEFFGDFKIINDNRYVLAVMRDSNEIGTRNIKIVITDSLGNIINDKIIKTDGALNARSLLPVSNGDILCTCRYQKPLTGDRDVYCMRMDSLLGFPPIGIEALSSNIPENYNLMQNYPNPFNPVTTLKFSVPQRMDLKFIVYDIMGREVFIINKQSYFAGSHEVKLDFGKMNLVSGVYFVTMIAGSIKLTRKMVLLK